MFDKDILKDVIADYKRDFTEFQWKNERYKWEAIQCFQQNWNINAVNFADMLKRSLDKTYKLLSAGNYYPREMIQKFATALEIPAYKFFMEDTDCFTISVLPEKKQDLIQHLQNEIKKIIESEL